MQIQEIQDQEMVSLYSPDGNIINMTLAPNFITCVVVINMLSKFGMGRSYNDLIKEGYCIIPIKVTIKQNGNEYNLQREDK